MSQSQHTIAGTVLTMPVRIRKADVHTAMFSVPADAAQKLIDYSGLRVCQFRPGRAVVNLMLARYLDGDLGRYNEFGTCVMVNPPGSDARGLKALGDAAAFIHHLPGGAQHSGGGDWLGFGAAVPFFGLGALLFVPVPFIRSLGAGGLLRLRRAAGGGRYRRARGRRRS